MAKYAEIFGKPGEGVHKHVYGFAIWDVIFTVIAAIILANVMDVPLKWAVLGLFVAGQGMHLLFGMDTAFIKLFKD